MAMTARIAGRISASRLAPITSSSFFCRRLSNGDVSEGNGEPRCSKSSGDPVFTWYDASVWKASAHNTKWCLLGCSLGEFGTLWVFDVVNIADSVSPESPWFVPLLALPLVAGLTTSVGLETAILVRRGLSLPDSLNTALGMSFVSMLAMEIAMEGVDLWFTGGNLGIVWQACAPMLVAGFLAPWPLNYWRLKKLRKSCH